MHRSVHSLLVFCFLSLSLRLVFSSFSPSSFTNLYASSTICSLFVLRNYSCVQFEHAQAVYQRVLTNLNYVDSLLDEVKKAFCAAYFPDGRKLGLEAAAVDTAAFDEKFRKILERGTSLLTETPCPTQRAWRGLAADAHLMPTCS